MNNENTQQETFYYTGEQARATSVSLSLSPEVLIFENESNNFAQETKVYFSDFQQ
jgi:hypothetical protein